MPFVHKGSLIPNGGPILVGGRGTASGHSESTIITNSGVVRVGDVIAFVTSGANNFVRRYNAGGDPILGILVSVVNSATGGQATPDSGTTDTWTVTSTNQTIANPLYAVVDISPWSIWSAPFDGTIDTTVNAARGSYFDPDTGANAGRLAEASGTRTISSGRGFVCHGKDPDASTRALVSLGESFILGF